MMSFGASMVSKPQPEQLYHISRWPCNPATARFGILGPVRILQGTHNFSFLRALCSILLSCHRSRSKRGATPGGGDGRNAPEEKFSTKSCNVPRKSLVMFQILPNGAHIGRSHNVPNGRHRSLVMSRLA